jgi:2-methylcitrate dehydratase PrpD
VLKVAVVAAAAELLCLAGEFVDEAILLNGSDKETLTAICAPVLRRRSKRCR